MLINCLAVKLYVIRGGLSDESNVRVDLGQVKIVL